MKSMFIPLHNQEIIERIQKLSIDTKPEWGKMNVSQMLVHCTCPLQVATGELKLKREFIGKVFGKIVKKKLTNNKPFKKNMPTAKRFVVKDDSLNFQTEKENLLNMVKRFSDEGSAIIMKDPHPFFGTLTIEEWDILQWKHLDHHLKQFGV